MCNLRFRFHWIVLTCILVWSGSFVYAQNANCLLFNGGAKRITTLSQALENIDTGDFTFEAWVRGEAGPNAVHLTIFSNRSGPQFAGTKFFFHNYWGGSNTRMLSVQLDAMNYVFLNNGTYDAEILDGNCHHVAITRDRSILTYYVDGNPIGTARTSGIPSVASGNLIWIGQDAIATSPFEGTLSRIKIWNAALTQDEVRASMNCLQPSPANLMAFWPLNEGQGIAVVDSVQLTTNPLGELGGADPFDPVWGAACCACSFIQPPVPPDFPPTDSLDTRQPAVLELPNVITPNGDRVNDLFTPSRAEGIVRMQCSIWNRWGLLMHETTLPSIFWDANRVSDGIYYYRIRYEDTRGQTHEQTGYIQVLK